MPKGKKFCPSCGASSGPRVKVCDTCGEIFPKKATASQEKPLKEGKKRQPRKNTVDPPTDSETICFTNYIVNPEGISCPYKLPHPLMDEKIRQWTINMFKHRVKIGGETYRFGEKALKYFVTREISDKESAAYFLKIMWETLATCHLSQFGQYTKEEKDNFIRLLNMGEAASQLP